MPDDRKRFLPKRGFGKPFTVEEWSSYWDSLSDGEKQSLRDKARWERMSLPAVAREWGASEDRDPDA